MALFIWTDILATGNEAVDQDHRELVLKVDTVLQAIAERLPNAQLSGALTALVAFTRAHFAKEEQAMAASGYPELQAHAAEHAQLLTQLDSIVARLQANEAIDAMALYTRLTSWVMDHILNFDKKAG